MDRTAKFSARDRLRKRRQYLEAYGRGKKVNRSHFVAYILPNGLAHDRLGLTVSRKIGKSVVRNRVKRRLREIFRTHRSAAAEHVDIVINVKRSIAHASFDELVRDFEEALKRREDAGVTP